MIVIYYYNLTLSLTVNDENYLYTKMLLIAKRLTYVIANANSTLPLNYNTYTVLLYYITTTWILKNYLDKIKIN